MKKPTDHSLVPYAVGAGIGVLNILAFLSAKRGLGVTTAFETLAAQTERYLAPEASRINEYIKLREHVPKTDWESLLVLGIPIGSYLATRMAGERSEDKLNPTWVKSFGPSRPKRNIAAFLGGAVMMLGSRMAKGCTSGHGITGSSQLALSSLIFTPLMFSTAAIAAKFLYKKENDNV